MGDHAIATDGEVYLPGGTGYDYGEPSVEPLPASPDATHGELTLPPGEPIPSNPSSDMGPSAGVRQSGPGQFASQQMGAQRQYTSPRAYSPPRTPLYLRNSTSPHRPTADGGAGATAPLPDMIGPVGYDVQ